LNLFDFDKLCKITRYNEGIMFEHYSESAKRSIFFGKHEARKSGSPEIETEHVLLGLLQIPDLTSSVLRSLAASEVRSRLTITSREPDEENRSTPSDLSLSRASRQALALAEKEAQKSGSDYVNPEHILVGLLLVENCFAAKLLRERHISVESVRSGMETIPTGGEARQHVPRQAVPASADATIISQVHDLVKKGQPRSALNLIDELLSSDRADHEFLVRLLCPVGMSISRQVGDLYLATNYGEQLLAAVPDDIRTLYRLAEYLDLQGQRERAKAYAMRCYHLSLTTHSRQATKLVGLLEKRFPEIGPESRT
jgi:hypothetical protein